MPTHIAAHIVETVYAIAEKAADLIKEDWSKEDVKTADQIAQRVLGAREEL